MTLPRSSPEAQGLPSAAVARFVDALDALQHPHSMMIVRHGHVVAEGWWHPYGPRHPHSLFSISKSVTSTAVGFAVAEGLLGLDDAVVSLLPDDVPPTVGANLAAMTVRHLLTMTTGHTRDTVADLTATEPNWAKTLLAVPVDAVPGSLFVYNTGATFLLSAIVQRASGERLLDYLAPRLLEPLGITDASWEQSPLGIDAGGWGLSITTEQIAAYGQLHLQRGEWNGGQVVPAEWVDASTRAQVSNGEPTAGNDGTHGYGYQFWRSQHDAYRADGAFGQLCIVLEEQGTVVVLTAGLSDMQAEMDTVWDHLLPALGTAAPLPDDPRALATLTARLSSLALPLPSGSGASAVAQDVSGERYAMAENAARVAAVRLDTSDGETSVTITHAFGDQRVVCGDGSWVTGTATLLDGVERLIAAAGAWVAADTYRAMVVCYETPFTLAVTLRFSGDEVRLQIEQNVSFGPTELVRAVGLRGGG